MEMDITVPNQIEYLSVSDDSSSHDGVEEIVDWMKGSLVSDDVMVDQNYTESTSYGLLVSRAKGYQNFMNQIPIPQFRGSCISYTSWVGLGTKIKQLYEQPLHYFTNKRLKMWDKLRIGSENEKVPLECVIHPSKAEATIWLVEEIHRQTSSYRAIADHWFSDSMFCEDLDQNFPHG